MLLVLRTYVFNRLSSVIGRQRTHRDFQDCHLEQEQDSFYDRNMHMVDEYFIPHS